MYILTKSSIKKCFQIPKWNIYLMNSHKTIDQKFLKLLQLNTAVITVKKSKN